MPATTRLPTLFESRVYAAARQIPVGKVATYGQLGASIGCRSSQAIGQALRRNPFAPKVPCHRIVRADLSPGGFSGQTKGLEIQRKLDLLRAEGVLFRTDGRIDPSCLHRFR
jgi:methylated-DNA-[protein]-cysteine S-methyltransferase